MMNDEKNHQKSNITNTLESERLNISNDYVTLTKNSNIKEMRKIKKIKNNSGNGMDSWGNKNIYNKNYCNTISNEFGSFKEKNYHRQNNNSVAKRKNSHKKYNNQKLDKTFNSYNLHA